MRSLLFFVLISSVLVSNAQDVPDFPDYRNKKESFAKVSEKYIKADLASFTIGGLDESIGKTPLKKISPFAYTRHMMNFKQDDITVTVTTVPFSATGKKIQKVGEHVVKIDGKPFYGSFGQMPITAIESVKVIWGKDTIEIPKIAYFDLYNLNFTYKDKAGTERTSNGVYFSPDGKRMYIYMLSKNEEGSYEVTWVIEDKKYFRRVLDWGFTK